MDEPGPSVNHVGICVSDLERSRRFYTGALGFRPWWELDVPDGSAGPLLRLPTPLGTHATYLANGRFVLELIHYRDHPATAPPGGRAMDVLGLTHLSVAVEDVAAAADAVEALGGEVLRDTAVGAAAVMVRDPDGQLLELTSTGFPAMRPPWPDGPDGPDGRPPA
ncbi:MAG: VOC family protein, partial [Acidimicrobiales bacterium]